MLCSPTGALYAICPEGCIYYFGLAWWCTVLQLVVLMVTIPVGVSLWTSPVCCRQRRQPLACSMQPPLQPQLHKRLASALSSRAQVMGVRTFRTPVLALLAANTAVAMVQCDGFLSTKLFNEFYGGFPVRINTVVAGASPPLASWQLRLRHQAPSQQVLRSRHL